MVSGVAAFSALTMPPTAASTTSRPDRSPFTGLRLPHIGAGLAAGTALGIGTFGVRRMLRNRRHNAEATARAAFVEAALPELEQVAEAYWLARTASVDASDRTTPLWRLWDNSISAIFAYELDSDPLSGKMAHRLRIHKPLHLLALIDRLRLPSPHVDRDAIKALTCSVLLDELRDVLKPEGNVTLERCRPIATEIGSSLRSIGEPLLACGVHLAIGDLNVGSELRSSALRTVVKLKTMLEIPEPDIPRFSQEFISLLRDFLDIRDYERQAEAVLVRTPIVQAVSFELGRFLTRYGEDLHRCRDSLRDLAECHKKLSNPYNS